MIENNIVSENGSVFYWRSKDWISARKTLVFLHGMPQHMESRVRTQIFHILMQ